MGAGKTLLHNSRGLRLYNDLEKFDLALKIKTYYRNWDRKIDLVFESELGLN